jgi:hypothetical protein
MRRIADEFCGNCCLLVDSLSIDDNFSKLVNIQKLIES